jgi:hypothetical protein
MASAWSTPFFSALTRIEIGDVGAGEFALIADVVDGEHRAGSGEHRIGLVVRAQPQGGERRMPVVGMHDVGPEIHALAALEGRARQHQEAAMFIRVGGVQARTREQRLGLHQEHRRGGAWQRRPPDVDPVLVMPRHDGQAPQALDSGGVHAIAAHLRIERHEEAHVVTTRRQLARQGAGHVGEPSGLGEGHDFGGNGAD